MKDEELERKFDEYFRGVKTPDNLTADAKKFVPKKSAALPRFVKFASVAAGFIAVLSVSLFAVFKGGLFGENNQAPDIDGSPDLPAATLDFYYDDSLTVQDADVYNVSETHKALKFLQNLAFSGSASVTDCKTYYSGGKLTLAQSEVSGVYGLTRYDSTVYVEFTDKNVVYYELGDYHNGTQGRYKGAEYRLTSSVAENGEPQFRLLVNYGGVKYYCDILSSDEQAYMKYLALIVN